MRRGRLLVAAALAIMAVACALLAADVHAWRDAMRHDDAVYVGGRAGADWRPQTRAPFGLAQRVLGVEPDAKLRRALELMRQARASRDGFGNTEREGARAAAEAALVPIGRQADPRRASQANALLGLLAFTDRRTSASGTPPVERALAAWEQAYRLDRSNEVAKFDLELVQRLMQANGTRPGESGGAAPGGAGRRGAGSGHPGSGY